MSFLPVLEAKSLECWQGLAPSKGSRGESFLTLSASGCSQCSLACGCITPVSAFHLTWPFPFFYCVSKVIGFRSHLDSLGRSYLQILNYTDRYLFFPIKVIFTGPGN